VRSEVCGSRNHDVAIKSAILIFFNGGGYTGGIVSHFYKIGEARWLVDELIDFEWLVGNVFLKIL